ncbi:MAG: hypothetical protein K2J16_03020 [Clostridia bacterium]|nr:hypothetical protein [Clostridia bacterium]
MACTVTVGLIATIIFEAAPDAVASIFGKPTNIPNPDDYWDFARKTFRIFLALITVTCTIKASSIFFQAVGKPVFAVLTSLIRDLVCFVPLVCVLPLFYGIDGVLAAAPISDAIAILVTVAMTVVYFVDLNKNEKALKMNLSVDSLEEGDDDSQNESLDSGEENASVEVNSL